MLSWPRFATYANCAGRVDADLGAGVLPLEVGRQRRDRPDRLQGAGRGVELVRRDAAPLLVRHVSDVFGRVEDEVARAGLVRRGELGRLAGGQGAGRGVEREPEDGVRPGVRHEGEAVGPVEHDGVGLLGGGDAANRLVADAPSLPIAWTVTLAAT